MLHHVSPWPWLNRAYLLIQDNVPAFDSKQAIEIVERNLGGSIAEKFDSFNPQPIAAASLGQVCPLPRPRKAEAGTLLNTSIASN